MLGIRYFKAPPTNWVALFRNGRPSLVAGWVDPGHDLVIESLMPSGGAIFSDGVEADFLPFDSGRIVTVRAANKRARLVVEGSVS